MADFVDFKVYFHDIAEVRRFRLPTQRLSFQRVENWLLSTTGKREGIYWKDDDGDYIRMSSEEEFSLAVELKSEKILRLWINPRRQSNAIVHPGVVCDGCEGEIRGVRYKCITCADYDLCEACERARKHADHPMVRLTRPGMMSPREIHHLPRFCEMKRMRKFMKKCGEAKARFASAHASSEPPCRDSGASSTAASAATSTTTIAEDMLTNIGNSVKELLDPLGIDVEVHVDSRTPAGETADTQTGLIVDESMHTQAPVTEDIGTCASNDVSSVHTATSAATSAAENAATSTTESAATSTPENAITSEAYTNAGTSTGIDEAVAVVENMVQNISVSDECAQRPQSATANDFVMVDHNKERCEQTLGHLILMGFTNEGGWLENLVATKEGDLCAVLDALSSPFHK